MKVRSFDVSGTCCQCGRETRITGQTMSPSEEERRMDAVYLLCHFHEGDHTFDLAEGEVRISPSLRVAQKPSYTPPVSVPSKTRVGRRSGEDEDDLMEEDTARFAPPHISRKRQKKLNRTRRAAV